MKLLSTGRLMQMQIDQQNKIIDLLTKLIQPQSGQSQHPTVTSSNQQSQLTQHSDLNTLNQHSSLLINQDYMIGQNQSSGFNHVFHSSPQYKQNNISELTKFDEFSSTESKSHHPKNPVVSQHSFAANQCETQLQSQNSKSSQQSNLSQNSNIIFSLNQADHSVHQNQSSVLNQLFHSKHQAEQNYTFSKHSSTDIDHEGESQQTKYPMVSQHSHVAELSNQTKCQLPAHVTESNQQPNFSQNLSISGQNFSSNQGQLINQNQSSGANRLLYSELQSGQCNTSELYTSDFHKHSSSKSESHQPISENQQPKNLIVSQYSYATDHNQFKAQLLPQNTNSNQQLTSVSREPNPTQHTLNFDQSIPESPAIQFQDYQFSDELDSWNLSTDDELSLSNISNQTRSNSISSTPFSDSSGSSTEIGPTEYTNFGPPPFKTPPKLLEVQDVLADHPGTGIANLRNLAISLAKDAIFGKDEMMRCSLSGRKNTASLDAKKLQYIKTIIHSRVPRVSDAEFESLWILCRGSISKLCQGLRNKAKKKLY